MPDVEDILVSNYIEAAKLAQNAVYTAYVAVASVAVVLLSVPQESVPLPLIGIAIRAPHAVVCLILLYLCSGVTCEFAVARCRSIEGQLGAHGAIARALRSYPAIVQSPFFTRLIVMVLVPAGALHNTLWFLGISWLKATCFTVLCAIPLARAAWKAGFWAEPHADGEP